MKKGNEGRKRKVSGWEEEEGYRGRKENESGKEERRKMRKT